MVEQYKQFEANRLEVLFSIFSKILLAIIGVILYVNCFYWTPIFAIIMIILFVFVFINVANTIVNFFVYVNTKPILLPEKNIIPSEVKSIGVFKSIEANSLFDVQDICAHILKDIENNQIFDSKTKYIILDETKDENISKKIHEEIFLFQQKYGVNKIFYFHRNLKDTINKSWGMFKSIFLLLHEGKTKEEQAFFDLILGDIRALGIDGSVEDILEGKDVKIIEKEKIETAFVSNVLYVWSKGAIEKIISKINHPENKDVVMYRPVLRVYNPRESIYARLYTWDREMCYFEKSAEWRLYKCCPFNGYGAINVSLYVKNVMSQVDYSLRNEIDCHFQAFAKVKTVLLEDVYILKNAYLNKIRELEHNLNKVAIDFNTVKFYFFHKFEVDKRYYFYDLIRKLLWLPAFLLWLVGMTIIFMFKGGIDVASPIAFLFFCLLVVAGYFSILNFLAPVVSQRQEMKCEHIWFGRRIYSLPTIVGFGVIKSVGELFMGLLDVVYFPCIFGFKVAEVIKGKKRETTVQDIPVHADFKVEDFWVSYNKLRLAVLFGCVFLVIFLLGIIPWYGFVFLLPFIAAFILGPAMVWYTAKPLPKR